MRGPFESSLARGRIKLMPVAARPGSTSGADRFQSLYQLLAALSRASGLEDVYDAALTSLLEATAADRAAILLFDDDGVMRFKASRGLSERYQAATAGHSPWQRGTLDANAVCVPDALADASLAAYRDALQQEGIRALAFLPLALDAGVFGKFMLYYDAPHEFGADELEMATAIAAHVALATQHKRAELERDSSEQRLRAILDNSPTVIFLKDLQGRYLLVNRRHEELFHIPRADMLGRTDKDIFPADTAGQLQANDRAVLEAGKPLAVEEQVPHDDGIHSYLSIKFPLEGPDGRVTGVCGIATDITERRQLENASRHLAAIVESSDDAIVSKDLNGIITSWNQGAERIFGYTAAEVIGKPVAILSAPDRRDEMPRILAEIAQGRRIEHIETRRRRKDGQIIDVALTVSPVRNAAGQIVGASKIARDISDRKLAEQERTLLLAREQEAFERSQWIQGELKRSNEELRRANQDLEMFAYSASHDLQEPLRTISISAQILARNWGEMLSEKDAPFLGNILSASNRMMILLEDLLAYTRATKYEEGPPPSVDSARVAANSIESLKGIIEEAEATVTVAELPWVAIHESRLTQLFQNLISNAIKYRGKELPRVHIAAESQDGWCVFSVVDNGIGIDPRYAEQIFGLFKRLHGPDEYPGSGIGLAICQRIVEQYGGRIWLERSRPGEGSTFRFSIPSRAR